MLVPGREAARKVWSVVSEATVTEQVQDLKRDVLLFAGKETVAPRKNRHAPWNHGTAFEGGLYTFWFLQIRVQRFDKGIPLEGAFPLESERLG